MAIVLTPDIIQKAATKFAVRKIIQEQASPGREAHIFNLYEDLGMPLRDILEIGRLALQAKVENIQEKMDGQYFAFTVRDGSLRVFTKLNLVTDSQLERLLAKIQDEENPAGMDLQQIREKFSAESMSGVREAFTVAYSALAPAALPYQDTLFKNGRVVVAAQVMHEASQNTIAYDENSLRFVSPISLDPAYPIDSNDPSYQEFLSQARSASQEAFRLDTVPTAQLLQDLEEDDDVIAQEEKNLTSLIKKYNLSQDSTVGDFVTAAVAEKIRSDLEYIPEEFVERVADRFATGKGRVGLELKKVLSSEDYQKYREADKRKRVIVDESIIPLEEIIQRIGISVIDKLDLALKATNRDDLIGFVNQVKNAFEEGFDFGLGPDDSDVFEKIRVALARLESNKDLFSIASEGIVFTYNNKTYKLTGLFTPINKLRGFFAYGSASLPSDQDILSEGGSAFKDTQGNVTTRADRIPRGDVSRILAGFDSEVLGPLGLKYVPIGSTATDTDTVGDLDIAVNIASKEELYKTIIDKMGPESVKKVGQLVAVKFQVPGSEPGDFVQIDLVPSASVDDTAWVMKGGARDGVKGVFRNLLFSYIAKVKSEQESNTMRQVKYSISWPGGLLVKVNGKESSPREPDPDLFLPMIGIEVSKDQVGTFEDLVKYMRDDPRLRNSLPGFRDYLDNSRYLQSKNENVREESQKAVKYIEESQMNESQILRNIIKNILKEETEPDEAQVSGPNQAEQLRLFTPASFEPMASITPDWLRTHSVPDQIYDSSSHTFFREGIPALLMGYEDSDLENEGEKFEAGIIEYTSALGIKGMERIGGEGEDLRMGNRTYESKKSKTGSPTLMFNSTFPKSRPGHFYLFTLNIPGSSLIRDVSDQLKESLGIKGRWSQLSEEEKSSLSQAWLQMVDAQGELESRIKSTIDQVESALADSSNWSRSSRSDEPEPVPEQEPEQVSLFEAVTIGDQTFNTKKSLVAYRRELKKKLGSVASPGPSAKRALALGSNIKVFVVPSADLRVAIMQSAFPGAFEGEGQIFDSQSGQVVKGGDEKIVKAIKDYLDNFGLEYKIAEKIAPQLIKDLVSGLDESDRFEEGWTMKMGLLGVRVKVYVEPRGTKN